MRRRGVPEMVVDITLGTLLKGNSR